MSEIGLIDVCVCMCYRTMVIEDASESDLDALDNLLAGANNFVFHLFFLFDFDSLSEV